jgi:arylsulfatase A-like enzyme
MKRFLIFHFTWLLAFAAHAASPKPNFLFLITDDQRWDALGVVQREQGELARFPWFETPNLDHLAAQSVRFRNAFATDPLCAPSRASILTGRYPQMVGVSDNFTPFPLTTPTYASLLRQAGYVTGYIGKWHMGTQAERPGFDETASYIGFGRYFGAEFLVNGQSQVAKEWVDDAATDYAIGFLKKYHDRPFALVVGFKSPHDPQTPAERNRDLYDGAEARAAVNENAPTPYPNLFRLPAKVGTPEKFLNYFRCLAGVDQDVGRLLDTLDQLGLSTNTVVIYMSDNGYYLGERHLLDKRTAYEESLRIPLLIRTPSLTGKDRTEDHITLNIDLAPTILDLAGVPVPESVQGYSLRPFLEDRKPDAWRDAFFFRYNYDPTYRYAPGVTGVRTTEAKLIHYPGREDWTEVFNLKDDPYELANLARTAGDAGLRKQLEEDFSTLGKQAGFDLSTLNNIAETGRIATDESVLDFSLLDSGTAEVTDASGKKNNGTVHGTVTAGHFDGKSFIEVPNSESLDPSNGPWTVEVFAKADAPNGVLLARGGKFQGYALAVEQGRPIFSIRAEGKLTRAEGSGEITGRWTHLAGVLSADGELRLYVDGKLAARETAPQTITAPPNEPAQIGADEGTAVAGSQPRFTGFIARVRLFNGARDEAAIRGDAAKSFNQPN